MQCDRRLLTGGRLMFADLGQSPPEQIDADVQEHKPYDAKETQKGQADPRGRIRSNEDPLRRQRRLGTGAEVHGGDCVCCGEFLAAFIRALDHVLAIPPVLR